MSKNNIDFALKAVELAKEKGLYSTLDCQGFVEEALKRIGIHKDYTGSNAMIRQMVIDIKPFNASTAMVGELLFWVRHDGEENEKYKQGGRRYVPEFDDWNATHVGVYLGDGKIAESGLSIGHWEITEASKRKPTHSAKHKDLVYEEDYEREVSMAIDRKDEQPETEEALPQKEANAYINNNGKFVNLRERDSLDSRILAEMQDGEPLLVLNEQKNRWSKVSYNGIEGFCRTGMYTKGVSLAPTIKEEPQEDFISQPKSLREEIEEIKERLVELENLIGLGIG